MMAEDVLRARARQLARPATGENGAPRRSLLRFHRAGDRFAVPLEAVRQVVRLDTPAWLPSDARPFLALAPLGDQIVPVLDLVGAGRTTTARPSLAWGVAVLVGTDQVALAADEVLDVVELADDEITSTGAGDDDARVACGVTPQGDAVVDLETIQSFIASADPRDPAPPAASARSSRL